MNAQQIRQQFLDFFESKGHKIVPSAPLVIKNDPTLMFTNAGMNQFKDYFLGNQQAPNKRVADTQKCLRVSGKHNDLEDVGHDTYHHTMFEMLGNWSFGDYFKEEAIAWAWELLTEVYKLDKDRLYVTVFEGDAKENLAFDQEAYDCWKKYIAEDRILHGNKKDNFWEMGDTGPCGPCSEIHVDLRPDSERQTVDGKTLVNNDHPQVIEIWNNVFMQYNRMADSSLQPLPDKHVDTGMGFERLVRAIEGKTSNYDSTVFMPLINKVEALSGIKYVGGDPAAIPGGSPKTDIAIRVIVDHIRAVAFTIADGQLPSSGGAGYVIRRILRRAVRYGFSFLNLKEPFFNQLVPVLAQEFGGIFPEIRQQQEFVQKVVLEEEISFLRTLENGLKLINIIINVKESADADLNLQNISNIISSDSAFKLYDTYGFPIDLTQLIAKENGWAVDIVGFETLLQQQKDRSRKAAETTKDDWVELIPNVEPVFVGYDELMSEAKIARYRKVSAKNKEFFQLVLDKTPFYAESGGQVGDTGYLQSANEKINIVDTQKENNLIIHITDRLPENPEAVFEAKVDANRRVLIADNHSATHLLHAALKRVLGDHVNQKGSLVGPDYLRFDFSHFAKMTDEEVASVERMVNQKIRENIVLNEQRNIPIAEAQAQGATALFGEKYGDTVRVITFDKNYSMELCGGTHVPATGQIGYFKITAETSVAAGVRRIEAITANKAEEFINQQVTLVEEAKALLNNAKDLKKGIETLLNEKAELQKRLEALENAQVQQVKAELKQKVEAVNGLNFIAQRVSIGSAEAIKNLAFALRGEIDNLFLVLTAEIGGKPNITVMISDNLVKDKGFDAGKIIRELAKLVKGGGGGQPFYATAGGSDVSGLGAVLDAAKNHASTATA
ncbi:MAG: alanine--tRNA ligase [Bacteroidetes bacterium]|nr:MAG: alanine--tRNA ligase [Bacteroidota bacterium]